MLSKRKILATAILAATVSADGLTQELAFEEVIVTAQKREEGLQETAIAITAMTSTMMDNLNIRNSSDFEAIVPSLSVRNEPRRLFLRGIGRVTNSLGTDPGVAVYNDQIYTSEIGALGRVSSLTTARIEVLRGPQGTLFGRNATGGAVSVTSLRPTEEFEHHVRGTIGNYDRMNWGVSSSGPITDTLGYRVYGYQNKHDGFIDNNGGDDIFDEDHYGGGAQLSWDASDSLNIWFSYQKDETDDTRSGIFPGGYLITPYQPDAISQDPILFSEQYQWDRTNPAVSDPYEVDLNDPLDAETDDNNRYTAHVTWDLEDVTVKFIGNYSESDYTATDGDLGFTSNPDVRVVESTGSFVESYSGEIQLLSAGDGPLQWVAGVYYRHGETDAFYGIRNRTAEYLENVVPELSFDPSLITPNPFSRQYWQETSLDDDTTAVYADGNYTFNDQWKLTLGVRYSYDEKEGDEALLIVTDPTIYGVDYSNFGFPSDCCGWLTVDPTDPDANRNLDDDWDKVTGRAVVDYTVNDDHLVYASISNGYKSGGFRLGSIQPNPVFDEEDLLSYEIGYKGTINNVLRINAAAYYYDYSDMQVLTNRRDANGIVQPEMTNVDSAEVKGFEVEATWLASESLEIMANYSYIDGEYDSFCCAVDTVEDPDGPEEDLSGNPLTQAPENKVYLNAAYTWMTDRWGEFVLSGSYSWVDERQYDVFDRDVTRADDYYRVDGMLTWFNPGQNVRVILSGRNLTEEETWVSLERVNSFGAVNGQANEPRTYSVEVQYDF